MRLLLGALLAVHGLIHLIGAAKAFGIAQVPQLLQPISRPAGTLWLIAALLQLATVFGLLAWPKWWWVIGAVAAVVSQALITSSWSDAKYGTVANVILLIAAAYGYLSNRHGSFQAQYDRAIAENTRQSSALPVLTDADLAHLPRVVQKYVRASGAVGQPRVRNVRARMRGKIRGAPAEPWMKFTAEQFNTFGDYQSSGAHPSRFFLMKATKAGLPIEALHVFRDGSATMRVKLASLVTVADAAGAEMNRGETVTVLNDMFLLAPATLVTSDIRWEEIDAKSARATLVYAGQTISAKVTFAESGELTDFDSVDRLRSSPDGKTFQQTRRTTPVAEYRDFGPTRLWSTGEARWHPTEGEFAYGRFELRSIEYNIGMANSTNQVASRLAMTRIGERASA